jgi:regulatory protein
VLESCQMNERPGKGARRPPKLLDSEGLWAYSLKALGARAHSISELRTKLKRRAECAEDIDGVVGKLREYGFLDDNRLAETYAAARRDNQGLGRRRVQQDLRKRRISPVTVDKAVDQAYSGVDESEMVEQFLQRKFRGKNLSEFLKEAKNMASAFRRLTYAGFSSGASIRVLKRYTSRAEELEDVDFEETDASRPAD